MDKLSAMRAFTSVVDEGSFSKAANALGVSKATVSKQVAELERQLEAGLLLRSSRHVTLTDIGRTYFNRCQQLLDDLNELENSVHADVEQLKGQLRISAPTTFSELYLAPAVSEFRQSHEQVNIELILADSFIDLHQYPYDLAIRIGELNDSSLIARRLATSSVVFCASPEYLKNNPMPKKLTDFDQHDLIFDINVRSGNEWRPLVKGRRMSYQPKAVLRVNSALLARNLAIAGCGIAYCPEFVVREAISKGQLVEISDVADREEFGIYAVYSTRKYMSHRLRTFIDFLVEWFDNENRRG